MAAQTERANIEKLNLITNALHCHAGEGTADSSAPAIELNTSLNRELIASQAQQLAATKHWA